MSDPNRATEGTEGPLPQSNALSEARATSLAELMSLDPEGLSADQERAIIAAMREQRVRFEEAEKSGKRVPRADSGAKPKGKKEILHSLVNVDDLGL